MLKIDTEGVELFSFHRKATLEWLSKYVGQILIEWHNSIGFELSLENFKALEEIGFKSYFSEYRFDKYDNFYVTESLVRCK